MAKLCPFRIVKLAEDNVVMEVSKLKTMKNMSVSNCLTDMLC